MCNQQDVNPIPFSNLKRKYSIIAACANNSAIGHENTIPWKVKEDFKYFKKLTENHIVIMGRKTFESMNSKPLKNRCNIVVSNNKQYCDEMNDKFQNLDAKTELIFIKSFNSAIQYLELFKQLFGTIKNSFLDNEVFIIGGASIYEQAFDICSTVYLTKIHTDVDGDTFFPTNRLENWINVRGYGPDDLHLANVDDYYVQNGNKLSSPFLYSFLTYINPKVVEKGKKAVNAVVKTSQNTEIIKQLKTKAIMLNLYGNIFKENHDYWEIAYAKDLVNIATSGNLSSDRTGTGTMRKQHVSYSFPIGLLFPAIRAKKVTPKNALFEMLWIMRGDTNTKFLKDHGVNYWDDWADENGELGPIYGKQMRNFGGVDQLQKVIDTLRTNPDSRRMMIELYNPAEVHEMALEPCHYSYQFCSYTLLNGERMLDLHVIQRSGDMFLGVPYDFMLFVVLAEIVSYMVGIKLGYLHHTINDAHVYLNHLEQVNQYAEAYMSNDPKKILNGKTTFSIKTLEDGLNFKHIDDFLKFAEDRNYDIFEFKNYDSYPAIKAPVAV